MPETMLNMETGQAAVQGQVDASALVQKSTDPVVTNVATPADYAAQYPVPLDTVELLKLCEEVSLYNFLPDKSTALKQELWREMTSLNFTSGSAYITFTDGECPEEYEHDGSNLSVDLKNIGVKKSLTVSDIKQSAAVAAANWNGINQLVAGAAAGEGMPGGLDIGTFRREMIRDLVAKEVRLGGSLVLNGWDRLLVQGDATARPLEFDGIEKWDTNRTCSFNTNDNSASGTFSGSGLDRFTTENCARPTHFLGHPQAIQEVMAGYFSMGNYQIVAYNSGERVTPGYNFSGQVRTASGTITVVADANFRRTDIGGGMFQADIWAFRMTQNGEPLVYKVTQFPLSYQNLNNGCTAISFEIWAKTALVIKNCCMHGKYTSQFTGRIVTTCAFVGADPAQ